MMPVRLPGSVSTSVATVGGQMVPGNRQVVPVVSSGSSNPAVIGNGFVLLFQLWTKLTDFLNCIYTCINATQANAVLRKSTEICEHIWFSKAPLQHVTTATFRILFFTVRNQPSVPHTFC